MANDKQHLGADTNSNVQVKEKETTPKKKKVVIIGGIVAVIVLIIAAVLFVKFYKIPYDDAKAEFSLAMEQYNAEVVALEERNDELDSNIELLNQVINAENIPVDELLLEEAQVVLREARAYPRDSAPEAPELSLKIDEVKEMTVELLKLSDDVSAMGDYSEIIMKVQNTEAEYRTMIENFKTAEAEVLWVGVDKENTVLRFVVKLSNSNDYILKGINLEWTAYDVDGAVVGNYSGSQPDIPANDCVYYVGGAGSANLSGTPANVDVKLTAEGLLTNRVSPKISVSNVQIKDNGFSWYTVSAECVTDSETNTEYLDGQVIVKDANGQIIDADFWNSENLPAILDANGKFKVTNDYFDLPTFPKSAEVYMYYKWE